MTLFRMLRIIPIAAATVANPPEFVHEPTESYQVRDVHGFVVRISAAARQHPDTTRAALRLMDVELAEVVDVIPPAALEVLREIEIWIEQENPDRPCACYHVDAGWLRANGYNTDKVDSVEISNTVNFVNWVEKTQPMMVLHELAHGYHDVLFGYDDAIIKGAFERAREAGGYEQVRHIHGEQRRHYALTNQMEYFAELTESFFGRNDYFPFTREELREHDPLGFAVIEAAWSLDPEAFRAQEADSGPWFDLAGFSDPID